MAVLIERRVVTLIVRALLTGMLAMEKVMVLFTCVLLQEVQYHLWHAHPLVQVHGAEAIERKGEGKKQLTHERTKVGSFNEKHAKTFCCGPDPLRIPRNTTFCTRLSRAQAFPRDLFSAPE